jgi:hypothetical protein
MLPEVVQKEDVEFQKEDVEFQIPQKKVRVDDSRVNMLAQSKLNSQKNNLKSNSFSLLNFRLIDGRSQIKRTNCSINSFE